MTDPEGRDEKIRPRSTYSILALAGFLHAGLLYYFTPHGLLFSGKPIQEYDYALHVYQVDRALRAFEQTGRLWSYDPFVLAGQPAGVVEDVTNKGVELFVIGAHAVGMNPWVAFNLYVFAIHLTLPFAAWAAARLFRLPPVSCALTALFWVVLWHFDHFLHWCWHVGMIAWGASSFLTIVIVGLMYRAVSDHRAITYAALGAAAALVTLLHPFAPVTLVVPLAALYARAFRRLRTREHVFLGLGTLAAASTVLVWIAPALRFRHDIGQVDAFLWPSARYVFFDWLDLLKDVLMTGQPVRTVFRTVMFAIAAVGLVRMRRRDDDRFLPLAILVVGSFLIAYGGGYSEAVRQTQPYRNIGPAALAAALVAACELPSLFDGFAPSELSRDGRAAVWLVLALAVPAFARTVLQFMPSLVPIRPATCTAFRPGRTTGEPNDEALPLVMGHSGPDPEYPVVANLVETRVGDAGRVVVLDWVLGEYLATFSHVPILGGIQQRNVPHVAAHPLRHDFTPRGPGDDPFARYLDEYAVAGVVTSGEAGPVDARVDLLDLVATAGIHRLYRARKPPSYFAAGSGRILAQSLNAVTVAADRGQDVVLKFHFLESLKCAPNCTVERTPADDDGAGFIRIKDPPASFRIFNAYD